MNWKASSAGVEGRNRERTNLGLFGLWRLSASGVLEELGVFIFLLILASFPSYIWSVRKGRCHDEIW